jgi:hypothetical protein
MNVEVVDAEERSKLAEQSLRALWLVDASLFEYCRCRCCGGLRFAPPSLTAPREERDPPES